LAIKSAIGSTVMQPSASQRYQAALESCPAPAVSAAYFTGQLSHGQQISGKSTAIRLNLLQFTIV